MNGKLNKNIGFSMLPFAFLFLFEPGYTVWDPLPDFIGYIILCFAIMNLADLNPRIHESLNGFKKGILIGFARLIAIYLLKNLFLNREQTMGVLLFAFVFAFFELIILLPAYRNLFEGLLSLGITYDGDSIHYKKSRLIKYIQNENGKKIAIVKESRKNRTEKCYSLTCAFLIIRNAAMALPEFTTLVSNSSYEFISLLRGFGILIALPLGLFWLIKMLRYCAKIRQDRTFIENASAAYESKARENPQYFTARHVTVGLSLILVSLVLTIDFYSDYQNLLPDFFFYAVILVSVIFLRSCSGKWKFIVAISSFGIITSVISHLSSLNFHSEFYPNAIRKNLNAYYSFYRMAAYHAIDAVVFILTVGLLLLLIWDIFKQHTDYAQTDSEKLKKEMKSRFILNASLCFTAAIFAGGGSVYFILSQPFYYTGNWIFYYSTMISVLLTLIFAFGSSYFISHMINSVKYRYRRFL